MLSNVYKKVTNTRYLNAINSMSRSDNGPLWQDDTEVSSCFLCDLNYTVFHRRHHCRKCGKVVCGNCSEQSIKYFPNTLIANPQQESECLAPLETYRTCDECVAEVKMIRRALYEARSSVIDPETSTGNEAEIAPDNERNETNEDPLVDNNSTTKYSTRTSTRLVRSSTHSSCANLHHSGCNYRRRIQDGASDDNLCPVCANNLLKEYMRQLKKRKGDIDCDEFESYKESHINDCLIAFDFNGDRDRPNSPVRSKKRSHKRNKMLVYNMPPIPRPKYETIPNAEGNSYDTLRLHPHSIQSPIDSQIEDESDFQTLNPNDFVGSMTSNLTIQPGAEKQLPYDSVDSECVICLEELKPGDKVGRLECLCVFHYKCIKDWFNKKGYGECPVHFLHQ